MLCSVTSLVRRAQVDGGPLAAAHLQIPTVDVGATQLAVHSARVMGAHDVAAYSAALQAFLSAELSEHRVRRYGTFKVEMVATTRPCGLPAGGPSSSMARRVNCCPANSSWSPGPMDRGWDSRRCPIPPLGKTALHLDCD